MITRLPIELSEKNWPCAWEAGGASGDTGFAQIVCNKRGKLLKPVMWNETTTHKNGKHALFFLHPGDIIIKVERSRQDYSLNIYQFISADPMAEKTNPLGMFNHLHSSNKVVLNEALLFLLMAVNAAVLKSSEQNCYKVYYAKKAAALSAPPIRQVVSTILAAALITNFAFAAPAKVQSSQEYIFGVRQTNEGSHVDTHICTTKYYLTQEIINGEKIDIWLPDISTLHCVVKVN